MSDCILSLPDGGTLQYRLERRPRRSIGLRIGPQGLVVHAPKRLSLSQLEAALHGKLGWIMKKLAEREPGNLAPVAWQDGAELHLLGTAIWLSVREDSRNRQPAFEAGMLYLAVPNPGDNLLVQRKVLQWYKRQALADFGRRLELLATRLGVEVPPLYLSNARTRWGSCNSKGEVRLNWRLVQAPPQVINYVICHELAHLREMNHSARFWAIVEQLCPDYAHAEKTLKALSSQLHRLDMHA